MEVAVYSLLPFRSPLSRPTPLISGRDDAPLCATGPSWARFRMEDCPTRSSVQGLSAQVSVKIAEFHRLGMQKSRMPSYLRKPATCACVLWVAPTAQVCKNACAPFGAMATADSRPVDQAPVSSPIRPSDRFGLP